MKSNLQKTVVARTCRTVLLVAALSLTAGAQALAAPSADKKAPTIAVTVSDYHSVAYSGDGKVWYWGGVADGGGSDPVKLRDNKPELMQGLDNVQSIAAQYGNGDLILKKDGTVWDWGRKYNEAKKISEFPAPKQIKGLSHITKISAVNGLAAALDEAGKVWTRLVEPYSTTPVKLANIDKAQDITTGTRGNVVILKDDGTVWEWLAYSEREANTDYNAHRIEGLSDVAALSHGQSGHQFATKKDGSVWGWGSNSFGSLGIPKVDEVTRPILIESLKDAASISTGYYATLVVKKDGTVGVIGALGSDSPVWNHKLRNIEGLKNVASVALGYDHAVAVTKDGKLWAWGQNTAGQLGDASFKASAVPIPVKLPSSK